MNSRLCAAFTRWRTGLAGALLVCVSAAGETPWRHLEGDWSWPTNYFAARDAMLDSAPRKRWLNVHDFGAKGDGVADDSKALQAALDSAFVRQRPLLFPAGTYRLGTLEDLAPHAHLSIGFRGRPGSLVLVGEGHPRLWSTNFPPVNSNEESYPTSPLLRVFAGVTNLLVQGLVFDRSGTPVWTYPDGRMMGNGDDASGLQLLPGRGQAGFDRVGIYDCEFINCRHAFSLYPRPLSLNRNPWSAFPTNAFRLVHIAGSRFLYTNTWGGTATWFDGVGTFVAESNRFDGLAQGSLKADPGRKNPAFNRTLDGFLYGQCEQLWARDNLTLHGAVEAFAYTIGFRPYEHARPYQPGDAVVFFGDLWTRIGPPGPLAGTAPGTDGERVWRRTEQNFSRRFVHRFLGNQIEGAPAPGDFPNQSYVGLRTDLASLVAVSNRFDRASEAILQLSTLLGLGSATGSVVAGSVFLGNTFTNCAYAISVAGGPALVTGNVYFQPDDRPHLLNGAQLPPRFVFVTPIGSGSVMQDNRLLIAAPEHSAAPPLRHWADGHANYSVAFAADNGAWANATGNLLEGFASGAGQRQWSGAWVLASNRFDRVVTPWEGAPGHLVRDETASFTPGAAGWYLIASVRHATPARGACELLVAGQPRCRIEVDSPGPSSPAKLQVQTTGAPLADALLAGDNGEIFLHFSKPLEGPASLRFTTQLAPPPGETATPAVLPASGLRWRWPVSAVPGLPAPEAPGTPPDGLLRLREGTQEQPLFR